MQSINEYVVASYNNAKDHGWHDQSRTIGDLICLMHSELSEALEEHRKGRTPQEIYYVSRNPAGKEPPSKPEGIPIELADCIIRIFDFCGLHNIDLEEALSLKMKYNETRPYRHGNKVV
jgi:NTP pyrophosphatase (non-canonical NTP hydrolase)